jgi:hypothetical protein
VTVAAGDHRANRVAARATGLGIGLITFMLTWTIGARITERILTTPTSAYVAMAVALLAGAITAVNAGQRLDSATHAPPNNERPRDTR